MRSVLVGLTTLLLVGTIGPVGLVVAWISGSPRTLFVLARGILRVVFFVGGIRLDVTGLDRLDPDQAYLFAANHVSNLDPPVGFAATGRDVRALAKAELFRIPVFGRVIRNAGFAAVDRADRSKAIEALGEAARSLASGNDFLAFPEGTRSPTGELQPFKKGPFVMAVQAQAPIVPVVLRGTRELWPRNTLRVRSGTVRVEFLAPIATAGLSIGKRSGLREKVRGAIAERLGDPGATLH